MPNVAFGSYKKLAQNLNRQHRNLCNSRSCFVLLAFCHYLVLLLAMLFALAACCLFSCVLSLSAPFCFSSFGCFFAFASCLFLLAFCLLPLASCCLLRTLAKAPSRTDGLHIGQPESWLTLLAKATRSQQPGNLCNSHSFCLVLASGPCLRNLANKHPLGGTKRHASEGRMGFFLDSLSCLTLLSEATRD